MSSKVQPPTLVSSVSTHLKKSYATSTKAISTDELQKKKENFMEIIGVATSKFVDNLNKGNVNLDNTIDLERLVKLTLILSGEADSITGSTTQSSETTVTATDVPMSKLDKILTMDDPDVKAMYEKIYSGYNEINDAEVGDDK